MKATKQLKADWMQVEVGCAPMGVFSELQYFRVNPITKSTSRTPVGLGNHAPYEKTERQYCCTRCGIEVDPWGMCNCGQHSKTATTYFDRETHEFSL